MNYWRFHNFDHLTAPFESSYNTPLVLLSIAAAALAALSALAVVDRVIVLRRRGARSLRGWQCIGATVMGSGIWAMHFTGMLAYELPVRAHYSLYMTLVSVAPAIIGSWFALRMMSRDHTGWLKLQMGGLMMAVGIGTMHYTGMEAMVVDAHMRYSPALFALSIVVAHVLATFALYVRFAVGSIARGRWGTKLAGAVVMGLAVAGMHYTAMGAVRFYPGVQRVHPEGVLPPGILAVVIAIVVLIISGLTVIGTIVDDRFTEASDSVLEAATRYESVLETMADGFLVLDEEGTIETFNPAAERIFDVSLSEVKGQPLAAIIVENENGDVIRLYRETGDSYLMQMGTDLLGRRPNGETFPIDVAVSDMTVRGAKLYTLHVRDVSERRSLEAQLSNAQKLESIGQLAAGIAHEVNTPTQYVTDNTRFLKDAFEELQPVLSSAIVVCGASQFGAIPFERLKRAVEKADLEYLVGEIPAAIRQSLDGLDRVSTIVRAMKEFSHPSAERTLIDINRAIESTVTVASNEWKYVATLDTDFDPGLTQVPCLPGDFNQTVLNMVVNAAHAIGASKEEREDLEGRITIRTRKDGDFAEIRIQDNGTGIPEEIRRKIFDPFFTTKEVGKGTGQGLSLAYTTVVKKHGGELLVDSTVGEGTSFTIRLPMTRDEPSGTDVKVPA